MNGLPSLTMTSESTPYTCLMFSEVMTSIGLPTANTLPSDIMMMLSE